MKNFNSNYLRSIIAESCEPTAYVRIETNNSYDIYLTTHNNMLTVNAPDILIEGVISGLSVGSESITPEKGFSVLGGGSIELNEAQFTDALRDLIDDDRAIFNNKTEIYSGTAELAIGDYEKFQTLYVKGISSTDVSYSINLQTAQIFSNKKLFEKKESELFKGFRSDEVLTEIEMLSTTGYELVEHDSEWEDSPNETVGYLKVIGQDSEGNEVTEILKYWSKDATKFYGDPNNSNIIERSVFRSGLVTATGTSDSDTVTLVQEYIYINLSTGKMILALLTGALYGQAGQTLPEKWHAGIDASLVNINSIEQIGFDLWNPANDTGFPFYIDNPTEDTAKTYIAREILRVVGLSFLTDVNGEIACKRYGQVITGSSTQVILNNNDITNSPNFSRNSGDVRNEFAVRWDYRSATQKYNRSEIIIDQDSIDRNGVTSRAETILLKAVRNSNLEINDLLKTVTDGIRTRLSNPSIKPSISASFRRTVGLEVMDVIGLSLDGYSDYSDSGDINRPFEIQSIKYDLLNRTTQMKLYGSSDKAGIIDINSTSTTAILDHVGYAAFESNLTGTFTNVSSVLTLTSDCDLGDAGDIGQTIQYFYDGLINLNGFTLNIFGTPIIDANIDARDSTINGVGTGSTGGVGQLTNSTTGVRGGIGYFGNYDSAEEGVTVTDSSGPNNQTVRRLIRRDALKNSNGSGVIDNFVISVDSDGVVSGIPERLSGSGGSGGLSSWRDAGPTIYARGANGATGGAGLMVFYDDFLVNIGTNIDLGAGQISDIPPLITSDGFELVGGRAGIGWGGAFVVICKDRSKPLLSNVDGIFESRCSTQSQWPVNYTPKRPRETGIITISRSGSGVDFDEIATPFFYSESVNNISNVNFAGSAFLSKYIGGATASAPQVGRDEISLVAAPENLTLTESINTPSTPLGNLSTITMNVDTPADSNYSHTEFSFRLSSEIAYYPATYKVPSEASFEVQSNGSEYLVKAQAISKQGVKGGISTELITVKNVLTQPPVEPEVILPKVTGLQLKNRIQSNIFDQFKSGNAEFVWNPVSTNYAVEFGNEGLLGADSGAFDPIFKNYEVKIYDESNNLLRTETTKTESYTYTYDKNKFDNNGTASRVFSIQIITRGQNNQAAAGALFRVENPQPESVTGISANPSYNSIQVDFTAPNDIDYKGVNMRFKAAGGIFSAVLFIAGTSCTVPRLDSGQEYEIELTSVDAFGAGSSTSVIQSTVAIEAQEVDGLSNWATELNPIDLAFVNANIDNNAIPSEKVSSLVAGKITAGQIDVAVDIGTGVRLDGANGTVTTTNNDFTVIVGNSDGVWNQLPNPTTITNLDTSTGTQTFAVDALGNTIIGNGDNSVLFNQTTNTIDFGSNVTIGSNENQTVTVGAGGDFSDWNAAVEHLSKIVPAYSYGGFTAKVNILSGTVMSLPLYIEGVDLSFIEITSDDAIVDVNQSSSTGNSFIRVLNGAKSPKINVLFRDVGVNTVNAVLVDGAGSVLSFNGTGTGMIDFTIGARATNSGYIFADGADFYNSSVALYAFDNGVIIGDRVNADNSGIVLDARTGGMITFAYGSGRFSTAEGSFVNCANSSIKMRNANFSDWTSTSGAVKVLIIRSTVEMSASNLSTTVSTTNDTLFIQNSTVIAPQISLSTNSGTDRGDVDVVSSDVVMTSSSDYDLSIAEGAIVRTALSSNTAFSESTNTITPRGIIFN